MIIAIWIFIGILVILLLATMSMDSDNKEEIAASKANLDDETRSLQSQIDAIVKILDCEWDYSNHYPRYGSCSLRPKPQIPNKLKILLDYLGVEFKNSPETIELVKKEELEK